MKKSKLTSIDELTDELIGNPGSAEREIFEYELKLDILGQVIKDARKKKNLTQTELGKIIGVQKAQISKLENNTKDFRIGTIIKALNALGAKVKMSVSIEEDTMLKIA